MAVLDEIRLDTENWDEIVRESMESISKYFPEWTDYNAHDPGITILELFAWMREVQWFHMDQTGEAHQRKYLNLLGLTPLGRRAGRTWVTVSTSRQTFLKAGFRFYAGDICFETVCDQMVVEGIFEYFKTVEEKREAVLQGAWMREGRGLALYPFGREPAVGNSFLIGLSQPLTSPCLYCLYVECGREGALPVDEAAYDGYGYYPLARIQVEYREAGGFRAVELETDTTYAFYQRGEYRFRLPGPMSETEPLLRFTLSRCDYPAAPRITRLSLAKALVVQQETVEEPVTFEGTGFPGQTADLEDERIDTSRIKLWAEYPGSLKCMELWTQVRDFDASRPEDRHYRVDKGILQFGDGIRGMPPEGKIVITGCARTLGSLGNVKSEAIRDLGEACEGILAVTNESDVTGGRDAETLEEAWERYRGWKKKLRAVTLSDYEELVREIPGLPVADCHAYTEGQNGHDITIAVRLDAGDRPGTLNDACKKNLYRYLEEKRMIGTRLKLVSPYYIYLTVTCEVEGRGEYRDVKNLVERALQTWAEGRRFGQGVSYGKLFGYLDTLPFVKQVRTMWLDTGGRGKRLANGDLTVPQNGLLILKEVFCTVPTQ